jgi:hypothetical protein
MYKPRFFYDDGAAAAAGGATVVVNTMDDMFDEGQTSGPTPPVAAPAPPAPDPNKPAGDPPPPDPKAPDPDAPNPDAPDPDAAAAGDDAPGIWDEINQLRGRELKFELPDNVEPDTPEAIIYFEKAVREEEKQNVLNELKETDPRAYAYKLHRENGGSDEDFFAQKATVLPDENLFADSIDLQRQVYESSLIAKGLNADEAKALTDLAVTDKSIGIKAKSAYDNTKQNERNAAQVLENQLAEVRKQNATVAQSLIAESTKLLTENSLRIRIPEAEKAEFTAFFQENVVVDNGRAYIAMELNKDYTAQQALEQLYMIYKKGDLSQIAKSVAANTQVNKFRKAAQKAGASPTSATAAAAGQQNNSAIMELIPD